MPPTSATVGLRSDRGPILLSLMLATALVALDATIIATASATIASELGSFESVPWLFSAYLLAQAVSTPLAGRLSDILGRKQLILAGVALFLVGSVLCGAAWSMGALIAGRVLQGLGAGAVMPVSQTIAADIYTLEERAKVQGYLASVWAMSSVVGPTLGGVFSEFASWRWIFFINIPLCVVAGWVITRRYEEPPREGERDPIDYRGAVLLTLSSTLLLLGLLEGGTTWAWASVPSFAVLGGAVVLGVAFVRHVLRAAHPIVDLRLLRRRVIGAATAVSLVVGIVVLGLVTYIPIYAQGVLGYGPLVAGFALAAMMVGWPLAASNSGRLYLRLGFRWTATIGSALVIAGASSTLLLGESSPLVAAAAATFLVGLGMGLTAVPTLIAAQASVAHSTRGSVTGINTFARSLGSALGVAVCGAIVNSVASVGPDGTPDGAELMTAMHLVFIVVTVAAVVLAVLSTLMPADRDAARERRASQAAA
ncbi:MDR family MFS transporter [Demequina activiva]|uniref:MFS-type drug efflux transporter P55 n=1 Tax=Demequina activiva TaxID=1582364 RepID=A0A919Q1Q3_9MICO|nr:MDR family MFS transporter [Demequina activiva]GIG53642.1 MFS transporter [Demequina activiva]